MPSNSPTAKPENEGPGKIFVVAMPIGHPDDITVRALDVLRHVEVVAAEDTRQTARILAHHGLRVPMVSYHEHNEERRSLDLLKKLEAGQSVALVSDAGTPTISDPGYRLVSKARKAGFDVVPIPGASAVMAALSVAGMPTDAFTFVGFPPKKKNHRAEFLSRLAAEPRTLVFYESPKRIVSFLEELILAFGDRDGMLAREMTKTHEEYIRANLSEIRDLLGARRVVKGEVTLLVAGRPAGPLESKEDLGDAIRWEMDAAELSPSQLAKRVADRLGIPKSRVYEEVLKVTRPQPAGSGDDDRR